MKSAAKRSLKSVATLLTKPALVFYALPWLMFLLVLGTVAQRYIGLYQAQKLFFGSFFLWVGPVPLPGAYSVMGLLALGLAIKLALRSPLRKLRLGIIIAHASIFMLLAGGLLTALFREEGYIILGNGESGHTISDYHAREFAVLKNDAPVLVMPFTALHSGMDIASPLPFTLHILMTCANCTAENPAGKKITLAAAPLAHEDEDNHAGVMMQVQGATPAQDGIYASALSLTQQPVITLGKDRYALLTRAAERELPFTVRLIHFDKSDYPGTETARSYRSEVAVKDGALEWNTVIEMNQPLRYRGYTLYQSSFVSADGKLFTVLAVVKNAGALFPYIAITMLCMGLVLHLATMLGKSLSHWRKPS